MPGTLNTTAAATAAPLPGATVATGSGSWGDILRGVIASAAKVATDVGAARYIAKNMPDTAQPTNSATTTEAPGTASPTAGLTFREIWQSVPGWVWAAWGFVPLLLMFALFRRSQR